MLPSELSKTTNNDKPVLLVFKNSDGGIVSFALSEISGYGINGKSSYEMYIRLKGSLEYCRPISFGTTIERSKAIDKINSYFDVDKI